MLQNIHRKFFLISWLLLSPLIASILLACQAIATPSTQLISTQTPTKTPSPTATATQTPTPSPTVYQLPTSKPPRPPTITPTVTPTWHPSMATGEDSVEMINIPAGEFLMGLSLEQELTLRSDWLTYCKPLENPAKEQICHIPPIIPSFLPMIPQLQVDLAAFKIDKLEVSQGQYKKCVAAGICSPMAGTTGEDDNYPAWVVWEQADRYCQWVSKRLPTEAEWEKAARGTDGRFFPWGNTWQADYVGEKYAPIGSHPQDISPYGVLDMAGSVSEWTLDDYKLYPGNPRPDLEQPEE